MRHALLLSLCLSGTASFGAVAETLPPATPPPAGGVEVRKALPAEPAEVKPAIPMAPAPATEPAATPEVKLAEPQIVFVRCEVQQPAIAITFDDGPHPEFTPRLLDILKEANIKATFFLVGKCVVTYPDIVKRMVDEGHEVANHSWSHPLLTSLSQAGVDSQMRRTHDAIIKACGVTPTLCRPPYGASRLTQRKRLHEELGYLSILWDVDPLDWQSPRSLHKVHDRVLAQTRAGSIILCHDIHETTVDAMPTTLAELKARGFQFMTVTELIQLEAKTPRAPGAPPIVVKEPAPLPPISLKPGDHLSLDLPGEPSAKR